MERIRKLIPESLVLILTFLLPLKFGATVGVPEMPMSYWTDPMAILVASWPLLLFSFAAAVTLAVALLLLPRPEKTVLPLRFYGWLWVLTAAACLPGWVHSTTWDFAAQNTAHQLGMLCWALALIRTLESDPGFARSLIGAMFAGLVFSVYSAFSQYLTGFEDTLKYIKEKEVQSGVVILEGQFGTRLQEARVSGDFTVCNSYAGYLVMIFPLLLGALWQLGGKITPPLPARLILTLPCLGAFLFLLKETGSRGGVLALLAGGVLVLPGLKLPRRWKVIFWSMLPLGAAGFYLLVRLGRGFNSMLIRFDYFQAAIRMMFRRPLTGAGWGEFLNDYLILKDVVNDEAPHSPHNFILTLGAQCGVPAAIFSALVLILPLTIALIQLSRRSRERDLSECVPEIAMVWGLGGWTVHSLMELNYETPGSLGLAVVLAVLVLCRPDVPAFPLPARLTSFRQAGAVFLLVCVLSAGAALWYLPGVIRAEMNFDVLHSRIDPRFSNDPAGNRPQPAEVRQLLAKCDPRSPFPYATASLYFRMLGPYYTDDALEMLSKAIERTPKRAAYHFRKSRILSEFPSRKAESEAALLKARELSPKNPQYYPDGVTPYGTRSY